MYSKEMNIRFSAIIERMKKAWKEGKVEKETILKYFEGSKNVCLSTRATYRNWMLKDMAKDDIYTLAQEVQTRDETVKKWCMKLYKK